MYVVFGMDHIPGNFTIGGGWFQVPHGVCHVKIYPYVSNLTNRGLVRGISWCMLSFV